MHSSILIKKNDDPFNINGIMIHLGLAIQLNKNINEYKILMMKHVIY
jgi:hypothetical protein